MTFADLQARNAAEAEEPDGKRTTAEKSAWDWINWVLKDVQFSIQHRTAGCSTHTLLLHTHPHPHTHTHRHTLCCSVCVYTRSHFPL